MVQRLLGPNAVAAIHLAKEVGVPQSTLSPWLRADHRFDMKAKEDPSPRPQKTSPRSAEDKLRIVLAAEAVPPEQLGAFLRREGVHEQELETWRAAVKQAATVALSGAAPPTTRAADNRR